MKKKLIILLVFIAVIITVIISWKLMISPQYSLKQLKKAIANDNIVAFDKYVDLDRTIDHALEQIWQYFSNPVSENGKSRWVDVRNEIGYSLLSMAKPNLKEIIKKEVYNHIISEELSEDKSEEDNNLSNLLMKKVQERINPEDWEYQSINYVSMSGDFAFLGLTYYDQSRDTNFIVEVKMRNMKGYWQIIEITNIAQLLNIFYNTAIP
jgi:hypothetical protein